MSKGKRKGKRKSTEQAPLFKAHSPEQVKEVALMLYAQQPFMLTNSITSEVQWNWLVGQAFVFLDNLDKACAKVSESRKVATLPLNANGLVLFNAAVKFITGQKERLDRAMDRFEVLPHLAMEELLRQKPATPADPAVMKRWDERIAGWRENGMKRDEVIWWRVRYDEKAYRRWRIATAGESEGRVKTAGRVKKRRKRRGPPPHPNKEDKPVFRAIIQEEAQRKEKEKLNALRKATQTGEIE